MKNVSLIKKIEYEDDLSKTYPVTFVLEYDFDRSKAKKFFNEIKEQSLLAHDKINVGNNSFTVEISLKNIGQITKILLKNNLDFYGVYAVSYTHLRAHET